MESTIYCFSGTGNSLKVAKDIALELKDTEIIQICTKNMNIDNTLSNKIGFIFPVYASGIPLLVKKFIKEIRLKKDAYVYTVVTFGSAAGASIKQLEEILTDKGIKLSSAFKVKMPGNYQVIYAPYSEEKQKECFDDEKAKISGIVKSLNNNEIVEFSGLGESLMRTVGGMVYGSFSPYKKDKDFWTDKNCNGCSTCSKVCPASNIEMMEGKPQWQHKCEQCLACMQWCPQKSIQYKKVTIKRGRYHHPDVDVTELFHL
ncbi:EFR1 family ferrodoxin [Clostridium estertheticum]|uniref:EFR1 family ferrodoxin n=1 Tax=Clostridium estertheticum TaxID=238834 RepID=UPI001C7D1930|nr:EFR1 family ferrodoxin [Clostridium estertheticum]MBX4264671.1 EFR1 family ferrodoxin [Clostridium estertheticum]WLC88806.1 EFR1 family ferrodoxin [Clostridium estertheticum]